MGRSYTFSSILKKSKSLRLREKENLFPAAHPLRSFWKALVWMNPGLGTGLTSRGTSNPCLLTLHSRSFWAGFAEEMRWHACAKGPGRCVFSKECFLWCSRSAWTGLFILPDFIFLAVGFSSPFKLSHTQPTWPLIHCDGFKVSPHKWKLLFNYSETWQNPSSIPKSESPWDPSSSSGIYSQTTATRTRITADARLSSAADRGIKLPLGDLSLGHCMLDDEGLPLVLWGWETPPANTCTLTHSHTHGQSVNLSKEQTKNEISLSYHSYHYYTIQKINPFAPLLSTSSLIFLLRVRHHTLCLSVPCFIHSLWFEHLVSAKPCSGHWGDRGEHCQLLHWKAFHCQPLAWDTAKNSWV